MESYEVLNQIGRGNFGQIYKIKRKSDDKILIWKELDYSQMSSKEKEQIVTEVNILRELDHPNIVKYYDRIIDKKNSKIYIIMEYCEGGDISQLINTYKKNNEYIPEEIIWKPDTKDQEPIDQNLLEEIFAEHFDWEKEMARLAKLPRQAEWEAHVAQCQGADPNLPSTGKWKLMEKIF